MNVPKGENSLTVAFYNVSSKLLSDGGRRSGGRLFEHFLGNFFQRRALVAVLHNGFDDGVTPDGIKVSVEEFEHLRLGAMSKEEVEGVEYNRQNIPGYHNQSTQM